MVVPTGKMFPAGTPVRVTVTEAEQPSLAVALPSVALLTNAPQDDAPGPVLAVTLGGAVIIGSGVSTMLTMAVASLNASPGAVTLSAMLWWPHGRLVLRIAVVPSTVTPSRHSYVSGSPSASEEAEPSSVTEVEAPPHSMVWSAPAFATGGVLQPPSVWPPVSVLPRNSHSS